MTHCASPDVGAAAEVTTPTTGPGADTGVGDSSKPAENVKRVPDESTMALELVLNRKLGGALPVLVPSVTVMDVKPTGLGPEQVPEGVRV